MRPVTEADLTTVLAMNNAAVPAVNALEADDLAWAFAAEVINEVPIVALRTHLARRILAQLPGAELLDEGVVSL